MEINHRIEFVTGPFDTETGELICVKQPKYGRVDLCFKAGMNIPFARIKLHTKDLAIDADAVIDDAYRLGQEIARRWNAFDRDNQLEPHDDESSWVMDAIYSAPSIEALEGLMAKRDSKHPNWPAWCDAATSRTEELLILGAKNSTPTRGEKLCQVCGTPGCLEGRGPNFHAGKHFGSLTCDYAGTPPFADAEWAGPENDALPITDRMCEWCAGTGHPYGDESYGMCECPALKTES